MPVGWREIRDPFVMLSALTAFSLLTDTLNSKGEINDTGMAQVASVNFSRDGSKIVGGGLSSDYSSGTIKVWGEWPFPTAMHPTAT